jgi:hypothetical protein
MPLEHTSMEHDRDPVDYAMPRREPSVPMGSFARGLGLLILVGGVVWAFLGTAGLDNQTQILIGCAVAGLGLLVATLGQILHAVETRR